MVTGLAQLAGEIDRLWKIFLEITLNHGRLGVDKAGVKMTLEHHQDALYSRVRRRSGRRVLKRKQYGCLPQQGSAQDGFHEFTALHASSSLAFARCNQSHFQTIVAIEF